MKYMLLIYGPAEGDWSDEAVRAEMAAYEAFEKAVSDAGVVLSSEALQPKESATTIAVGADGERVVTDGPFAETREVLGGYYLVDLPDLDTALDWAARCPGSHGGDRIEVRPVFEFPQPSGFEQR